MLEKRRILQVKELSNKDKEKILEDIIYLIEEELSKNFNNLDYSIRLQISDDWPYILDIDITANTLIPILDMDNVIEKILDKIEDKINKIFEKYGLEEAY